MKPTLNTIEIVCLNYGIKQIWIFSGYYNEIKMLESIKDIMFQFSWIRLSMFHSCENMYLGKG